MFGWAKTKQHAWFLFLTALISSIIMGSVKHVPVFDGLVGLMVALSLSSISLAIVRDHHFTFADLFTPLLSPKRVVKFFVLGIACIAICIVAASPFITAVLMQNPVAAGMSALLLIPLTYFVVRFKFFPFVVIEHENASIKELIKLSFKVTSGSFVSVFVFLILGAILNILGAMVFGVGLFVTVPVTFLAMAHFYDKLKERHTA